VSKFGWLSDEAARPTIAPGRSKLLLKFSDEPRGLNTQSHTPIA
jgi:hypothetical protein